MANMRFIPQTVKNIYKKLIIVSLFRGVEKDCPVGGHSIMRTRNSFFV